MLWIWAGAGPTTELSSHRGWSGAGRIVSESDEAGANMPHALWTWAGVGPTTELSSQTVVPEPGGPSPSRTERELTTPDLGRRGTHD